MAITQADGPGDMISGPNFSEIMDEIMDIHLSEIMDIHLRVKYLRVIIM